jgi:hypothetical protein
MRQSFAALYIEGFYKIFKAGRVDRPRAVGMMFVARRLRALPSLLVWCDVWDCGLDYLFWGGACCLVCCPMRARLGLNGWAPFAIYGMSHPHTHPQTHQSTTNNQHRRTWAGISSMLQHDITFGLLPAMATALRVSLLELEGPESVRLGPHPAARSVPFLRPL